MSSIEFSQVGTASPATVTAAAGPRRIAVVASLTSSLVNFRLELLKALVAAGHEVTAFAPDEDAETVAALKRLGIDFRRIPMQRTGMNPLADLATLFALWRAFRRLRPDALIAYTMKPVIYGGLAARLSGVRDRFALFTGFGYLFGEVPQAARTRLVRRIGVALYREALRGARAGFVYNEADAAEIVRHRMLGPRTRLLPVAGSGVDLSAFPQAAMPGGPPVFLLVARLLREKGIAEFVEAARALKRDHRQARFEILGPLDPSPLGFDESQIAALTADGAARYLGSARDVRPHLARAHVFVLPSYYREGIPRSALEALATGRAVVTTDAPGCRETVENGENGFLVPPRDAPALAEAMRRFILDPALAGRMGERSRRLAEERFDVHAVNRTLLDGMALSRCS